MNSSVAPGEGADLPPDACALAELESLIDGCLAGHSFAVRAFVDRYQGPIFGLCYRMLSNRHDAEDMSQETLVRAIRHLHQWDRARDILPWLLSIAGNRCRTLLSKRKNRPVNGPLVELAADDAGRDDAARQLEEELRQALETLRPDYRRAFLLFHEQELGYDEIGRIIGSPLGTVKTWIHRARKEIIQALKDRDVFEVGSHAMRRV